MKIMKIVVSIGIIAAVASCTDRSLMDMSRQGASDPSGNGLGGAGASDSIRQGALDGYEESSPEYFSSGIGDKIYFLVDESTINADAAAILSMQASWLVANPGYTALIEGHADERGTREYNLALGARRASAVREYLVSQGVPDSRLQTVTYGKERPAAVCSNESCWSQNRRAITAISLIPSS